ncbi:Pimeloyl-ACP methyl ester carboxylesterase [Amycolatopsis xylanica]|uniref:Pimeloyl-ACP methyl ester carboxylesterase n=1 Tax=Amycolatopsis xylanica TaxID=589385 RepID=A0A1H2T681_9PSEU|nr:alpha/beta fold hydrolase [Amycolatopsis xylanica]SDW38754.1 Pimeloyl-ACP methyl ester carboxylesterase [Amycolatopsis xylanica]
MNGIHHESRGSGPVLLFIPGGNGDAGPYSHVSHHLADRFTTVTYDRRGFSRSPLEGEPDDAKRLDVDVEDALGLLNEFTDQPAFVFGSSSGAIVALHLLVRHPDRVKTVVAHEPPLAPLLPDGDKWLAVFQDIHDTYRAEGLVPAMRKFGTAMGMGQRQEPAAAEVPQAVKEMMARMSANMHFWMRHELLVYPSLVPDLEALDTLKDRIVLAGGLESKEHMPYLPNVVLADRFGAEVVDFPGDHIGYAPPHAAEFAERLAGVLTRG